ncbi:hypothetical protein Droror1_Dr00019531 [Drosera rotundifolia]
MDNSKEITTLVKEQGPLHYMLKIESFSSIGALLKGSGEDCIKSFEFSAGGCKWVLKIHWNENKDDQDKSHISMFLRLIDKVKPGEVVTAMFRFYVHNQKLGNYLVVQGKHIYMKTTPILCTYCYLRMLIFLYFQMQQEGILVLPISEVMDASKGYILDDCCVVGVEVFSAKSEYKFGTLAVVGKNSTRQYTWKVAKFSALTDARLYSPVFTIDGISWSLSIYPKGNNGAKGESLSLFLNLMDEDGSVFASGNRVFAKYEVSIKDQLRNNYCSFSSIHLPFSTSHWFDANANGWGKANFIPLSDLKDPSKGYLENDELLIQVNFESILRITSV